MYVPRIYLILNLYALTVNAIFLCLAFIKTWPVLLWVAVTALCLVVMVAFSYEVNQAAKQQKSQAEAER